MRPNSLCTVHLAHKYSFNQMQWMKYSCFAIHLCVGAIDFSSFLWFEHWTLCGEHLYWKHTVQSFQGFLSLYLAPIRQWKHWTLSYSRQYYTLHLRRWKYGELNANHNYFEYIVYRTPIYVDGKSSIWANVMEFCIICLICLLLTRLIFKHECFLGFWQNIHVICRYWNAPRLLYFFLHSAYHMT